MTVAAQRVQISVPHFMQLDGQWQVVMPGSVVDMPTAGPVAPTTATVLAETPGNLAPHGKPTPVRNIRTG